MTTIVDKNQDSIMQFKHIKVNEFFKYNNSVYLKLRLCYSEGINAFNLSQGEVCRFYEDDLVQAVNTTVTVEPQ